MANDKLAKIRPLFYCDNCHYECSNQSDFNKHMTTDKHNRLTNTNKLIAKIRPLFYCDTCHYGCSKQSDYNKHLATSKHDRLTNPNKIITKTYVCGCGKQYKHMSSLCKHKTRCHVSNQDVITEEFQPNEKIPYVETNLVIELLKQNHDFKDLMIEQSKQLAEQNKQNVELREQLLEAVKDGKLCNNTTNNTTNNKFNLNLFLNETCKDAITMNEFINSIEVTMDDFIRTGKIGFVDGISSVMVERIKGMDMHTRPMHCTDLKRETIYIKNDYAWEKGDIDKTQLRRAVKNVANKNYKQLKPWFDSSQPEVDQIGTDEYENYFQYYKSALGGCGKEEDRKFEDKIIKNVLKEVVVDK